MKTSIHEKFKTQTPEELRQAKYEMEKDCINCPEVKSVEEELTYKEHQEAVSKRNEKGKK